MQLTRRIRALEQRQTVELNAAIERELVRFTPEEREEFCGTSRPSTGGRRAMHLERWIRSLERAMGARIATATTEGGLDLLEPIL